MYLWHGEDVGKRLFLGALGAGAYLSTAGVPENVEGWAALAVIFLTATVSKSEEQARKLGKKG
jgi:hypothetical protein